MSNTFVESMWRGLQIGHQAESDKRLAVAQEQQSQLFQMQAEEHRQKTAALAQDLLQRGNIRRLASDKTSDLYQSLPPAVRGIVAETGDIKPYVSLLKPAPTQVKTLKGTVIPEVPSMGVDDYRDANIGNTMMEGLRGEILPGMPSRSQIQSLRESATQATQPYKTEELVGIDPQSGQQVWSQGAQRVDLPPKPEKEPSGITPVFGPDGKFVRFEKKSPGSTLGPGETPTAPTQPKDTNTINQWIEESQEVGPDKKPTPRALLATANLDIDKKRREDIARAGAAAIAGERAKDIDVPALAKGIIDGNDSPSAIKGSMGNPLASKVKSEVYKAYPNFNMAMSDANYKWKQSATNQRTINFAGGALPRLTSLDTQLSALPNVNLNTINRIMREVSIETGKPEYTNYESNRNAIVQEVNTALSGSSQGSDMRIIIELENLKSARSPQQIRGAISNLREALIARMDVDLSPLYPIEVVRGEKTMDDYKKELWKQYRGKYGIASEGSSAPVSGFDREGIAKELEKRGIKMGK